MPHAIGLDVYGTLVDPLAMAGAFSPWLGARAEACARLWRQKQLEYTFLRALMKRYDDFTVCTRQALDFATRVFGLALSDDDREHLLGKTRELPAYPDVVPGLRRLREGGHVLVAFSNGTEAEVRATLDRAGVSEHLDGVVSVDEIRTYKPDPAVYLHLVARLGRPADETWLVSGNPFDVLGALSAGLRSAWVCRRSDAVFDPWGVVPDLVVTDLGELANRLG